MKRRSSKSTESRAAGIMASVYWSRLCVCVSLCVLCHWLFAEQFWQKSIPLIVSASRHGMKLKFTFGMSLGNWSWLITSSTWSYNFFENGFWSVTYTSHETKLTISIIFFYLNVSQSFTFIPPMDTEIRTGDVHTPSPVCEQYMEKDRRVYHTFSVRGHSKMMSLCEWGRGYPKLMTKNGDILI